MTALPQQSESVLVRAVIAYINARGGKAWRNNAGFIVLQSATGRTRAVSMSEKGLPDVIGVLPNGRLVAVECKRPGNDLTGFQRYQLDELRARNALVIVAYSITDVEVALAAPDPSHVS